MFGKKIGNHLEPEVFKSSFQFLLLVVVGGGVSLLYDRFSKEKELEEKRFLAERELKEKQRDLIRQMHSELLKAFNDAKRVRRKLRAHVGYSSDRGLSPGSTVRLAEYKAAMEALMDAQLTFEVYAKRAEKPELGFVGGQELADDLRKVEGYLNEIIDEYEAKAVGFQNEPSGMALKELFALEEFIGPREEDKKFNDKFKHAFRDVLDGLSVYEARSELNTSEVGTNRK